MQFSVCCETLAAHQVTHTELRFHGIGNLDILPFPNCILRIAPHPPLSHRYRVPTHDRARDRAHSHLPILRLQLSDLPNLAIASNNFVLSRPSIDHPIQLVGTTLKFRPGTAQNEAVLPSWFSQQSRRAMRPPKPQSPLRTDWQSRASVPPSLAAPSTSAKPSSSPIKEFSRCTTKQHEWVQTTSDNRLSRHLLHSRT